MVRDDIEKKLKEIFLLDKVTFSEPGSFEQDTLFIEVETCRERPSKGYTAGKITGNLVLFSQSDKVPLGFFAKRINKAKAETKAGFFFFEVDTEILGSQSRFQNISERRCRFQYLYQDQYDPRETLIAGLDVEQISYLDVGDGRIQGSGNGPVIGVNP